MNCAWSTGIVSILECGILQSVALMSYPAGQSLFLMHLCLTLSRGFQREQGWGSPDTPMLPWPLQTAGFPCAPFHLGYVVTGIRWLLTKKWAMKSLPCKWSFLLTPPSWSQAPMKGFCDGAQDRNTFLSHPWKLLSRAIRQWLHEVLIPASRKRERGEDTPFIWALWPGSVTYHCCLSLVGQNVVMWLHLAARKAEKGSFSRPSGISCLKTYSKAMVTSTSFPAYQQWS